MALDMIVESLDSVGEAFRGEYVERDGKFVLDVTGAFSEVDRNKLQESLRKERDDHKSTRGKLKAFGENTPDSFTTLSDKAEELQLALDATEGSDEERAAKNEELAERKALAKIRPLERQLKTVNEAMLGITSERDGLLSDKRRAKILGTVLSPKLLKEVGIVAEASDDVELWALHNFEVDEHSEKVVSKESLGTPGLGPKDVFTEMKANGQRRHWFGPTQGAGAAGGKGGEQFENNPFSEETFSLTRIGQLVKADTAKAVRMAKAASSKSYDALRFLPAELKPS